MTRRSLLVVTGWLGAVVLAVLVGLGAISVIGSRLTSSDASPRTEADVQRELAALPGQSPVPTGPAEPAPTWAPPRPGGAAGDATPGGPATGGREPGGGATTGGPATTRPTHGGGDPRPPVTTGPGTTPPATGGGGVSRSFNTRAGNVVARCTAAGATIESMAPVAGFAVHERDTGPRAEAEGEFRGVDDNHDRVKFSVTCAGGRPVIAVEDENDD